MPKKKRKTKVATEAAELSADPDLVRDMDRAVQLRLILAHDPEARNLCAQALDERVVAIHPTILAHSRIDDGFADP